MCDSDSLANKINSPYECTSNKFITRSNLLIFIQRSISPTLHMLCPEISSPMRKYMDVSYISKMTYIYNLYIFFLKTETHFKTCYWNLYWVNILFEATIRPIFCKPINWKKLKRTLYFNDFDLNNSKLSCFQISHFCHCQFLM